MRVKFVTTLAGPAGAYQSGDIAELSDDVAEALLAGGVVVVLAPVNPAPAVPANAETATPPAPQTATPPKPEVTAPPAPERRAGGGKRDKQRRRG